MSNEAQDLGEYDQYSDLQNSTSEVDMDDLQGEISKAMIVARLIKADYRNIRIGDELAIFTQELKTGNVDGKDYKYCISVYNFISAYRSFRFRYFIGEGDPEKNDSEFIKQLLINAHSRIVISNSRQGMFIKEYLRNISEKSYSMKDDKGFMNKLTRRQ